MQSTIFLNEVNILIGILSRVVCLPDVEGPYQLLEDQNKTKEPKEEKISPA